MFWDLRATSRANDRADAWRDELALAVLFYVLTICAWQTRRADILFIVMASVFVALRIIGGLGYGTPESLSRKRAPLASVVLLGIMWAIYAIRLLLGLG
jgi:hypothetical protein